MGLSEYRRKRDFARTPEPAPSQAPPPPGNIFVVQKHAASSLHYDLRLRVGGVLHSWAIPKGPSLDPREKRLAIEVEDHPLEYAEFEGVIPDGLYGAGVVMVWDHGRWTPEMDAPRALAEGMIKFRLEGLRLRGRWMLVRTQHEGREHHWLLIKERDSEACAGVPAETFATSVLSGRTMGEIRDGAPARRPRAQNVAPTAASLNGARPGPMPSRLKPQLATPADRPPEGLDWLHEVKFDGYRLLLFRGPEGVIARTRSGLDWSSRIPEIVSEVRDRVPVEAVLDGEAVVLDARGVSDFQALQNAFHSRRSKAIVFMAFDLPWCDGHDLSGCPLEQRRSLLKALIGARQEGRVRLSESIEGNGPVAFARSREHGLEGIVSKRRDSSYSQARSPSWVKVKCFNQQEFIVGGFSEPEGSRAEFGALLLGCYDAQGRFRFAGKVGTGFSTETLRKLGTLVRALARTQSPFHDSPSGADARGVTWLEPTLVAQVQFREWTAGGTIRHASFRGLREDIEPASITREASSSPTAPASETIPPPPKRPARLAPVTTPGLRISSPARVVFPDRGTGYSLTKLQLVEYYQVVAERMLPHLAGRPLAIIRCPSGEGGKAFFQKHPAKGFPPSIKGVLVPDDRGVAHRHIVIHDVDGLIGLVQMNALEFHAWGAPAASPEAPDRLVFDLDPGPGVAWKHVAAGAQMVRQALEQVALRGFARVSGGKGVHVVVPLKPGHDWDQVKSFSKAFAQTLVRIAGTLFVAVPGEGNRARRIFIDYLRNARGATAVASYSVRARPGAPVALPVSWDELPGLESGHAFGVPAVLRRLGAPAPDPWESLPEAAGVLPNAPAAPRHPASRPRVTRARARKRRA
ncbi:MAG: DNA ligase D [Phycisphaerales bacterium]